MVRLRFTRLQRGLSYTELADLSQVGERTIGGIERGEVTPNPSTLIALAIALEWPVERASELIGEIVDPAAPVA